MTPSPKYIRVTPPSSELPAIEQFRWFWAVIVLDADYSQDWQKLVSRWLVDSGCLYMMAWGPNCSSWDDSVDYAQIMKFMPSEPPDDQDVMTTWHPDETLESVFWFARNCAFDAHDRISNSLLIHVGEHDREVEFLSLFEQAADLAEREVKI